MEIEFLVPETGRPKNKPFNLTSLKTNARRLRFLDMLTKHTMPADYKGISVKVLEPAAYVINKIITSARRSNPIKKEKDIRTAIELGEYILNDLEQKALMKSIFTGLNLKIQSIIIKNITSRSGPISELLKSNV
jgi:hypothetical protein